MTLLRSLCLLALAVFMVSPLAARAEDGVVLTVDGAVAPMKNERFYEFTIEDLEMLPTQTFTTATIWTSGRSKFEGVPLKELLEFVGAQGNEVKAVALNDYSVVIPIEDARMDGPILAFKRDGELMPTRDKGPVWIVYPFDNSEEFQTEVVYSRSIWQLKHIEILP
ncbi:MAG: molybdopterin-dependent oxidoreductase [Mangrovicoccus sp.]